MKKSELYARYHNFNSNLIEITRDEFFEHFTQENIDIIDDAIDGSTYTTTVRTDGWNYVMTCSHWNVGWQGDVDCDTFYCKIETVTKAEMEEMRQLFCSEAF
jgi:hypothetical protein